MCLLFNHQLVRQDLLQQESRDLALDRPNRGIERRHGPLVLVKYSIGSFVELLFQYIRIQICKPMIPMQLKESSQRVVQQTSGIQRSHIDSRLAPRFEL